MGCEPFERGCMGTGRRNKSGARGELAEMTRLTLVKEGHTGSRRHHAARRTHWEQDALSDESPTLPWLVEHAACILSRCQQGRDGKTPCERLHGKKPTQEFVPLGEKVLAKQTSIDEQDESQVPVRDMAWNANNAHQSS